MLEHEALLAAIGRALGLSSAYAEYSGPLDEDASRRVLGGDRDALGRVAWIEEVIAARPAGSGYVPVSIDLKIAADGAEVLSAPIESYNPYFGCSLRAIAWFDDTVVSVYHEKHHMLVWAVRASSGDTKLRELGDGAILAGDLVIAPFAGEPGLLEVIEAPSLLSATPIPVRGAIRSYDVAELDGGELAFAGERVRPPDVRQRGFPKDGVAFTRALLAKLFDTTSPGAEAELIVASAIAPFITRDAPRAGYGGGVSTRGISMCWAPVYAHRAGAQKIERILRELAAPLSSDEPERGYIFGESAEAAAMRLAEHHLRRRAHVLARVCARGKLPSRWYSFRFTANRHTTLARALPEGYALAQKLEASNPGELPDEDDDDDRDA